MAKALRLIHSAASRRMVKRPSLGWHASVPSFFAARAAASAMLRASVQAYPSEKMRRSAWQLSQTAKASRAVSTGIRLCSRQTGVLVRCSFALE